jgi:hypothetical protein
MPPRVPYAASAWIMAFAMYWDDTAPVLQVPYTKWHQPHDAAGELIAWCSQEEAALETPVWLDGKAWPNIGRQATVTA